MNTLALPKVKIAVRLPKVRLVPLGVGTLIVLAFAYILRFGSACPIYDEWELHSSRIESASLGSWLLQPLNGHRYPTAKLLWHGLNRMTSDNPWTSTVLTVLLLGGSAIAMVKLTAMARGAPSLADLMAPALLLHWGHAFNLLMGFQIAFALISVCTIGLLWQIVRSPSSPRAVYWASIWAVLMCSNGAIGLITAAAAAVWLVYLAWRQRSWISLFAPLLIFAYGGWCINARSTAGEDFPHPSPLGTVLLTCGYQLIAFGPWVAKLPWHLWAMAATLVYLIALSLCLHRVACDRVERPRALGLALLMAAHLTTALAVSWLRGQSLAERFVTPSVSGWCIVLLVFVLYGPCLRGTGALLFLAAIAVTAVNLNFGYWYGMQQRGYLRSFLKDAHDGVPPLFLGGAYAGPFLIPNPEGQLIDFLRVAGVGPLAKIAPNPKFRCEPVTLASHDGIIVVPAPSGPVLGLRIRTLVPTHVEWAAVKLEWTADGVRRERSIVPVFLPRESPAAFWVNNLITKPRLTVVGPPSLRIISAEWLLAE